MVVSIQTHRIKLWLNFLEESVFNSGRPGSFGFFGYCDYRQLLSLESLECILQRNISNCTCCLASITFARDSTNAFNYLPILDVSSYGFFGLQNTTSVWMNYTLPSPALNISAYYFERNSEFSGYDWVDPRSEKPPFQDPSNITLAFSNQTYSLNYIQSNGRCQAVQDVGICPAKER